MLTQGALGTHILQVAMHNGTVTLKDSLSFTKQT